MQTPSALGFQKWRSWEKFVELLKKKPRPELAVIKPEKLGKSRARMLNPTVVERYMTDLGQKVYELKLNYKPNLIWNCDETGKQFQHNPVEVIAQEGAKNRTNITHGLY